MRRLAHQRDHARWAHHQFLDPAEPRDESRRAGWSAEAPGLERPGQRVEQDSAVRRLLGQLADDTDELVVGRGVRLVRVGCGCWLVTPRLGPSRLGERRRRAPAATTPPSPAPPRPTCRLNLTRLHRRRAGERAIGEPAERDAEAAATSPTASKARSSDTISSTSPGRAAANHTPALTAIRRSLQSFTPEEGALWTSWAPWRASRRAVSGPITRQFPTATNSVRPPRGSMARCSITRAMCAGWLAFSTS